MVSNVTTEIKQIIKDRIEYISKKPIDKDLTGFKIHVVKSKREGYIEALKDALNIIIKVENQ